LQRKREGNYHCEVADEYLIVSDGFNYDFYTFELVHTQETASSLFKEINLAFQDKLLDYYEVPH
jgi:hypothetical protein